MTNEDWKGNTQSVMATLNASNHSSKDRPTLDYYATPAKAVRDLLRLEIFSDDIWECACGEKAISNIITEENVYNVRSSDIVDRCGNEVYDFLSSENQSWHGDIITNPPFAKATDFLVKALDIVEHNARIAFFLRIQFLEGIKRREIFNQYPPEKIYVASRNLRCALNGDFANATGNASTYCWMIWTKGYQGLTTLEWFNPV